MKRKIRYLHFDIFSWMYPSSASLLHPDAWSICFLSSCLPGVCSQHGICRGNRSHGIWRGRDTRVNKRVLSRAYQVINCDKNNLWLCVIYNFISKLLVKVKGWQFCIFIIELIKHKFNMIASINVTENLFQLQLIPNKKVFQIQNDAWS